MHNTFLSNCVVHTKICTWRILSKILTHEEMIAKRMYWVETLWLALVSKCASIFNLLQQKAPFSLVKLTTSFQGTFE